MGGFWKKILWDVDNSFTSGISFPVCAGRWEYRTMKEVLVLNEVFSFVVGAKYFLHSYDSN